MNKLDDRTAFEALDFPRLLDHLASQAQTRRGARAAASTSLSNSLVEVRKKYKEVQELIDLEQMGAQPHMGGILDVADAVLSAAKGDVLELEALLEIRATITGLHQLDDWLNSHARFCPELRGSSETLALDRKLREQLDKAFNEDGTISETRYPRLREIREQIASLEKNIRHTLDDLVRGDSIGHLLQDRYATLRRERWVLPVRASAKRSGLGIVHDTSRSGETVFIEPNEVVELNNRSKLAEGELAREELRILTELSRLISDASSSILSALDTAEQVDLTSARFQLGKKLKGTIPELGDEGVMALKSARHPLLALSESTVVPNDLVLDSKHPALVISGPNAGGKTVALKTIGLCALMTRCAIPLPALAGSRADVFDSISTVLGDAQGIESGLSTFSAHILAIRKVLDSGRGQSLVLLDELASGTDPIQGAALARAVLEQLVETGARVVATTHFSELKALSATDPRFRSAAMQFENDAPTYCVEVDREGRSHAFSIARRFGLPEPLLQRAREIIGKAESARIDTLDKMDEERARLERSALELEALRSNLDKKSVQLDAREQQLHARAEQQIDESARATIEQFRIIEADVVELIGRLQADPGLKSAGSTLQAIRQARKQVAPKDPPLPIADLGELEIGDTVRHRVLGANAKVIALPKDGRVEIRSGSLQIVANLEDLEHWAGQPRARPSHPAVKGEPMPGPPSVRTDSNTLDLRGFRVDEAIAELDRFLDRRLLKGDKTVFLLHGHGTGALKSAIRAWLGKSRTWRPLDDSEGGDAFTLVML